MKKFIPDIIIAKCIIIAFALEGWVIAFLFGQADERMNVIWYGTADAVVTFLIFGIINLIRSEA